MYPRVLQWLAEGKLVIDQGRLFYEQVALEKPIQFEA